MAIVVGPDGVLTVQQFRTIIPAFSDSSKFNDDSIEFYLQVASTSLNANRWGQWYAMGMALWTGHFMSLDAREAVIAARGGIPGQGGIGVLSSKSIGGVSASYDVTGGKEKDAGMWNLTTYGQRYIHLARLVGSGGVQITGSLLSGTPSQLDFNGPIF